MITSKEFTLALKVNAKKELPGNQLKTIYIKTQWLHSSLSSEVTGGDGRGEGPFLCFHFELMN